MAEKTLIARTHADADDTQVLVVTSPAVGLADGAPRSGLFLNPLDRILTMKILNQRYVLRLPRDTHGRLTEVLIPNQLTPVEYGQPLARLDPRALAGGAGADGYPVLGSLVASSLHAYGSRAYHSF